jgi:serine/threonine protein kinase
MMEKNMTGKYSLKDNRWSSVSQEAKTLVTRMMEFDPARRISCSEILRTPFICNAESGMQTDIAREFSEETVLKESIHPSSLSVVESFADAITAFVLHSAPTLKSSDPPSACDRTDDDIKEFLVTVFSTHGTDTHLCSTLFHLIVSLSIPFMI